QGKYELALAHLQAAHAALEGKGMIYGRSYTGTTQKQTTRVPWFPGRGFPDSELNLERVSTNEHILFLQAQATLDILLNRGQEAETALWESYRLATQIGDRGSQAFALHLVGWLRSWGEQIYEAIRLQEQAHELYVAIG